MIISRKYTLQMAETIQSKYSTMNTISSILIYTNWLGTSHLNNVIDHLLESSKHSVIFEADDNQNPEQNSLRFEINNLEALSNLLIEINEMLYFNVQFTITK